METEKKGTASPKEVEMPRPELIHARIHNRGIHKENGALWLRRSNGWYVIVKDPTFDPFLNIPWRAGSRPPKIGDLHHPCVPEGPEYTGPIDDELMANILIYG